MLAVRPVRTAILRLDPAASTFTSNHLLFAQLCLEAKSYRAALPLLDQVIFDFPAANTSTASLPSTLDQASSLFITTASSHSATLHYTDHLEYHLYGAMIYAGLKKWSRAIECLRLVVSAPSSNTASKIMVEAYKKLVLVSLIHRGRVSLPCDLAERSRTDRSIDGVAATISQRIGPASVPCLGESVR